MGQEAITDDARAAAGNWLEGLVITSRLRGSLIA